MGVPLAHVPAPAGSDAPRTTRGISSAPVPRRRSSGLGIQPDLYWMSEFYDRARSIRTSARALDARRRDPRDLPHASATVEQAGTAGCRSGHLRELRPDRHDHRHATGTARPSPTTAIPSSSTWARGCGFRGRDRAVRRPRQAGLERRLGRELGPVRRHDRGLRQGPRHGRRLARPRRRDLARGLRARAAAQRRLRVPEHRRPEDEHVARARARRRTRSRTCCRRSSSRFLFLRHRPNQAIDFDPDGTDTIPRLFDEFDRIADATAGRDVKGELPPNPDRLFALLAWSIRTPTSPRRRPRYRPPFLHLSLILQVRQGPVERTSRRRRGAPLTTHEQRRCARAHRRRRALAGDLRARNARATGSRRTRCRPRSGGWPMSSGCIWLRWRWRRPSSSPQSGEAWQALIFDVATARRLCRRVERSGRCTSRSSADRTARARAGCWRASTQRS